MALEGRRSRGCRYRIIAYIQRGANVYGTYVERQRFAEMSNAQGHAREGVRLRVQCFTRVFKSWLRLVAWHFVDIVAIRKRLSH